MLEQKLYHVSAFPNDGFVEWSPSLFVPNINVNAMFQHESADPQETSFGRHV
jgi:hypothetical protein